MIQGEIVEVYVNYFAVEIDDWIGVCVDAAKSAGDAGDLRNLVFVDCGVEGAVNNIVVIDRVIVVSPLETLVIA